MDFQNLKQNLQNAREKKIKFKWLIIYINFHPCKGKIVLLINQTKVLAWDGYFCLPTNNNCFGCKIRNV